MKNILKITAAAALALCAASCQEFEDYTQTVGGASQLIYANVGSDNMFKALIVHRPQASTGEFTAEFGVSCNTPVHAATEVTVVYDAAGVETYNQAHGTSYAVLPENYLILENTTLALAENAVKTEQNVIVSLDSEADLSLLAERYYLAPLRVVSKGIDTSGAMGTIYLLVETETNIIRPISSADDMVGFPAVGRSSWFADCSGFRALFDGDDSTSIEFESQRDNTLVVDMRESQYVTGLALRAGGLSRLSIEYSIDGENWLQAGTPAADEWVASGSNTYVALADIVEAQYLRLSFDFSSSWSMEISEIDVYKVDSTSPEVYTIAGAENLLSGKVVHKAGRSTSTFESDLYAYVSIASASGYTVNFSVDESLVDAYNRAHGTSYAALPAANLSLSASSLSIAGDATRSESATTLSLSGDLSQLTDKGGYLAAVKLSASGVGVSESRGVVYVLVDVEYNLIRPISSVNDLIGFPGAGRSSWSADCDDFAKLFDGSNGSNAAFTAGNTVLTIDMKSRRMVTALHCYTYNFSSLKIEFSADGQTWESAGVPESNEVIVPTSSWSAGDYYVAFTDYLDAQWLRLSFSFSSNYFARISEIETYEIESTEPTIYAMCGTDNVMTGAITHHVSAGPIALVNAAFDVYTTISSASGYEVSARVDESLVSAYNREHGTSFAAMPAANVLFTGSPCTIAAGSNKSSSQIGISLTGDISQLTDKNGYLIPVTLSAPGAVVSGSRGTVYVEVEVSESDEVFMKNFSVGDIVGTPVADHSGWTVLACDQEGVHSSTNDGGYANLFDGDPETYVRTWGGPISFTVDMGQVYDMTGMVITSSTWYSASGYCPNEIMIEYSTDGENYETLGTAAQSDGSLLKALPAGYAAFYAPVKARYLKIVASYGSNMGTGEFNIYVK